MADPLRTLTDHLRRFERIASDAYLPGGLQRAFASRADAELEAAGLVTIQHHDAGVSIRPTERGMQLLRDTRSAA